MMLNLVLSLPMRNWNRGGRTKAISLLRSFKPTYEELKPEHTQLRQYLLSRVLSLPMRNWNVFADRIGSLEDASFKPTYEELKLFWKINKIIFRNCFKPTYEELKLVNIIIFNSNFYQVLSLPMRNWNQVLESASKKLNKF